MDAIYVSPELAARINEVVEQAEVAAAKRSHLTVTLPEWNMFEPDGMSYIRHDAISDGSEKFYYPNFQWIEPDEDLLRIWTEPP